MDDVEGAPAEQRLLARLDALASRVEEQARIIAEQSTSIAQQRARIALLERTQPGLQVEPPSGATRAQSKRDASRRGLVKRLLGAAAAAAVLTVAKEPPAASAYVRGTILGSGGSTDSYGFISSPGTSDPIGSLPPLGSQTFALIGTTSNASPAPTFSSAVAGFGNTLGGVIGLSNTNVGAYGQSTSHAGVFGQSNSSSGVFGQSASHVGVYGTSAVTGVVGLGSSGAGVQGASSQGAGVHGESQSYFGVYGASLYTGVYGVSPTIGVWGTTTTGTGVFGQVTGGSGFAGNFSGNVYIAGGLTVAGPYPKSAAVQSADGTLRRMYCQESPEPYFEDFGRGTLVNGQATVTIDPEFASLINAAEYLVFLTEIGDGGGLFVSSQTPTSFTVQSRAGRDIGFGYRLVSRRKDLTGARMERVQPPDMPESKPKPKSISSSDRPRPLVVNGPDASR